jgi:type II secretory pathway component PulF
MSDERLLAFTRALSDSVSSGLPMADTLRKLSRVSWGDRSLADAADSVSRGRTLHESLAAAGLFPRILIALIRAGEESGKIDKFLDRFSAALESRIDFHRRLKRALVYPAFAAGLAGAIFLLFSTKGAPLLLRPLVDAGVAVPEGALRAIRVGEFLVSEWPLLLGGAACVLLLLGAAARSAPGRKARALAGHWFPGVCYATEEARHYQFAATLELLLAAGLRPRQIMEILVEYFRDDPVVRRRLTRGAAMLADGKSFTESVGSCLPSDDRPRLAVAEASGRLDEALGKLAVGHREQHLHRLKLTASAVQISSVAALAPLCFALILWILWPTLTMLRQAASLQPGTAELAPSGPPPMEVAPSVPAETAAASRFNETNAPKLLGFMREHAAEDSKHGTGEGPEAGADGGEARPAKKKMVAPRLKARSMNRLPHRSIEPTTVRSGLD